MGHEMSGTVVEVGHQVTTIKPGQRVAIIPTLDDRHFQIDLCNMCRQGWQNLCKHIAYRGFSAPGGGFADEAVVTWLDVVLLPDSISLKLGALIEPLAVALHMVCKSMMKEHDTCVILGAGPIGLALLLLLKQKRAQKIIVSEVSTSRAVMAKHFGADIVVNPLMKQEDGANEDLVVKAAQSVTDQDGVDIAFDACGLQSTLDTAIACVRPKGTIFNVATHKKQLSINLNDLTLFGTKLDSGICYTRGTFEAAHEIITWRIGKDLEKMITAVTPLEQIVENGFEELVKNKAKHVKILVEVSREGTIHL
jgi:(R,R)-butanediol dehydrogenase/meso-butanediol dehydrogenase/diacetyl reductase